MSLLSMVSLIVPKYGALYLGTSISEMNNIEAAINNAARVAEKNGLCCCARRF